MLSKKDKKVYMPQLDRAENYQSKFEKFKKLYPALQDINK
jgi:sugar (pentulose or hexulose) kinase